MLETAMIAEKRLVSVGIGEVYATKDPLLDLVAYGLGSCVGLTVYDVGAQIGGVAHILLPSSREADYNGPGLKFADLAVPALLRKVLDLGAVPRRLVCKIVGGAHILTVPGFSDGFKIGQRNVRAVKDALDSWRMAPVAMETGGSKGRTLRLVVATGQVFVKTAGQREIEL
jgi:chemotaxis protein CheD